MSAKRGSKKKGITTRKVSVSSDEEGTKDVGPLELERPSCALLPAIKVGEQHSTTQVSTTYIKTEPIDETENSVYNRVTIKTESDECEIARPPEMGCSTVNFTAANIKLEADVESSTRQIDNTHSNSTNKPTNLKNCDSTEPCTTEVSNSSRITQHTDCNNEEQRKSVSENNFAATLGISNIKIKEEQRKSVSENNFAATLGISNIKIKEERVDSDYDDVVILDPVPMQNTVKVKTEPLDDDDVIILDPPPKQNTVVVKTEPLDDDDDDDIIILDPPPKQNIVTVKIEPLDDGEPITQKQCEKNDLGNQKRQNLQSAPEAARNSLASLEKNEDSTCVAASVKRSLELESILEENRKKIKTEPSENTSQNEHKINNDHSLPCASPSRAIRNKLPPSPTNNDDQVSKKCKLEATDDHNINQELTANTSCSHTFPVVSNSNKISENNVANDGTTRKIEAMNGSENSKHNMSSLTNNISQTSLQNQYEDARKKMDENCQSNQTTTTSKCNTQIFINKSPCVLPRDQQIQIRDFSKYLQLNVRLDFDEFNDIYQYILSTGINHNSFGTVFFRKESPVTTESTDKNDDSVKKQNQNGNLGMNTIENSPTCAPKVSATMKVIAEGRLMLSPKENKAQHYNARCSPITSKDSESCLPNIKHPTSFEEPNKTINISVNVKVSSNELKRTLNVFDSRKANHLIAKTSQTSVNQPVTQESSSTARRPEVSNAFDSQKPIHLTSKKPQMSINQPVPVKSTSTATRADLPIVPTQKPIQCNSTQNQIRNTSKPVDTVAFQESNNESIINTLNTELLQSILDNVSISSLSRHPNSTSEKLDAISRQNSEPPLKKVRRNSDHATQNTQNVLDHHYEMSNYLNSFTHAPLPCDNVNKPTSSRLYQPKLLSNCKDNSHSSASNIRKANTNQRQQKAIEQLPADNISVPRDPRLRRQQSMNSVSSPKHGSASTYTAPTAQKIPVIYQSTERMPSYSDTSCHEPATVAQSAPNTRNTSFYKTNRPHQASQSSISGQASQMLPTHHTAPQSHQVTVPATAPISNPPPSTSSTNHLRSFRSSAHPRPHEPIASSQRSVPAVEANHKIGPFPLRSNRPCIIENLRKAIGKRIVQTNDVTFLILEWNGEWLKIQSTVNIPPPISDLFFSVKDIYDSFEEYFNTYFPLHLVSMWYNIYDNWKEFANFLHFTCSLENHEEKMNSVRCIGNTIIENDQFEFFPKRDGLVLITLINEGRTESLFGYIFNVLQKPYNPSGPSEAYTHKKIKFHFYTATVLNAIQFDMLRLCNIKIPLKQIEALHSVKSSKMKNCILNPVKYSSKIKRIQLSPDLHELPECIEQLCSDNVDILLMEKAFAPFTVSTIFKLVDSTVKEKSIALVFVRNSKKLLKLAEACMKYNLVLAVKTTDVFVSGNLKMYTLRELADNSRAVPEKANYEVLKRCQVILTVMDNIYLDNIGDVFSILNLTCIIDDAQLCTETEALLPFVYNVNKLVLMSNTKDDIVVPDFLKKYRFQKTLSTRLSKPFS